MEYKQTIFKDHRPVTFSDCLCDKLLKLIPEYQTDRIKLNFRALPHFEKTVKEMRKEHEKNCSVISDPQHKCQTCEVLKMKNMAIPILNEDQLAN